jgi:hypothetical protein
MHSLDVPEHPRKLIVFMGWITGGYPALGTSTGLLVFGTFLFRNPDMDG